MLCQIMLQALGLITLTTNRGRVYSKSYARCRRDDPLRMVKADRILVKTNNSPTNNLKTLFIQICYYELPA